MGLFVGYEQCRRWSQEYNAYTRHSQTAVPYLARRSLTRLPPMEPQSKHYLGIRYEPGMFSSSVARTAPFALASLLK